MFWKPTVAIQGDVGSFVVSLARSLRGYKCDPDWPASLKVRDQAKEDSNKSVSLREPVHFWVRLLKGLKAYPVDKATITICIST